MKEESSVENMKQYLYGELSVPDDEAFENELWDDDRLFDDLTTLETDLLDRYAAGVMDAAESRRFEAGLEKFPARHEKLKIALALQKHIAAVKSVEKNETPAPVVTSVEEIKPGWRIWDWTAIKTPLFQYAGLAVLLLIAIVTVYLVYRNNDLRAELARISENQTATQRREAELEMKEAKLHDRLNDFNRREQELQEAQNAKSADLRQREELLAQDRERLEKESESSSDRTISGPTFLTITLKPFLTRSAKDEVNPAAEKRKLSPGTKAVNLRLTDIPNDAEIESYDIYLNDRNIRPNVKAPVDKVTGFRYIELFLQVSNLQRNNTIIVKGRSRTDSTKSVEKVYELVLTN